MSTVAPAKLSTPPKVMAQDIMTTNVLSVYEGWSIKRLSDFFVKHGISGAPVIASDHQLVGVVSVTDIVRFDSLEQEEKAGLILEQVYPEYLGQHVDPEIFSQLTNHADENCTVNSIMTPEVISVEQDTPLTAIARLMYERKIRRIFVTKNQMMAGVISTSNILKYLGALDNGEN
ncbi:MAG: CBS domain-containing protein [Ketobacteraceae bacterium]|nr:CBS domain-containing protein [Ketobacteraceae bacterium]